MHSIAGKIVARLFSCAIWASQTVAFCQGPSHRVKVEFRLAEESPGPGLTAATVPRTGQKIYLHKAAIITSKDIIEAHAGEDPYLYRHYRVTVVFTKRAAQRMRNATQLSHGRLLVILIDDKVISALAITAPISDTAAITGPWTKEEAEGLARALDPKSGAKPADPSRVALEVSRRGALPGEPKSLPHSNRPFLPIPESASQGS